MYIMSVILCLFSAVHCRVGALQISITINVVVVVVVVVVDDGVDDDDDDDDDGVDDDDAHIVSTLKKKKAYYFFLSLLLHTYITIRIWHGIQQYNTTFGWFLT